MGGSVGCLNGALVGRMFEWCLCRIFDWLVGW